MKDTTIIIDSNLLNICSKQTGLISQLLGSNHIIDQYTKIIRVHGYTGDGMLEITKEKVMGKTPQITKIKVGRLLNIINLIKNDTELAPSIIEKTSRDIIGILEKNDDLEIVQGGDIINWYYQDNYLYPGKNGSEDSKGSLSKSCMRYKNTRDFLKLYSENPERIRMMIRRSGDKITARALLWTLDDGKIFMDRVYFSDEAEVVLFNIKAKNMGWYYYQTIGDRNVMYDNKKVNWDVLKVTLKQKPSNNKYPYLDAFKFYYPIEDFWSGHYYNDKKLTLKIETTSGGYAIQSIDDKYSLTDDDFEKVKIYLGSLSRNFDTTKLSFPKKIEYGKILGSPWRFITKSKWTNDKDLLDFIKVKENLNSISGNLILENCDYEYIKNVVLCIEKSSNVKYEIKGNIKIKFNDLIIDLFDKNNTPGLINLVVDFIQATSSVTKEYDTIQKEIYSKISTDDSNLDVIALFENSYINNLLSKYDTENILKNKLIAHIKNKIKANKKINQETISMSIVLNNLINNTGDISDTEYKEIVKNYDQFIEKVIS